jgi:hypothetical protein
VLNINKKRAIPLTISIYISRRDSTTAVVGGGIDSRDITWKSKKNNTSEQIMYHLTEKKKKKTNNEKKKEN